MNKLHRFSNWKIVGFLIFFLLLGLRGGYLTASAETASTNQALTQVYLNEKYISLGGYPVIVNGHTLVPVRNILENLGAALTWDERSQTITACKSTTTVSLTIGSYNAMVNGRIESLNEPPQIIEGQAFASLVFMVESFGGEITWDKDGQVVRIYCGSGQQRQKASVTTTATQQPGQTATPSTTVTQQPGQKAAPSATATQQPEQMDPGSAATTEQQVKTTTVSVTASDLHIRSDPSTSSDVIGLVPYGTILAYVGEKDGWYQVKHQGQLGWVASWYVTSPLNAAVPTRGKTVTLLPVPSNPEGFVRQMKRYAEIVHKGTSLPVNLLLAQWAEESGYGTSSLAQYYNNFGGIKCSDTGGFKQYSTPDEFAQDVIRLFTEYSQYDKLLTDARNGASLITLFNDLSRCGYASSRSYGEKIRTQYLPTIDEVLENL